MEPTQPAAAATTPGDLNDDDKLAMALIALASTGIGGLVGGREGAMAGGVAGGKAIGTVAQDAADKGKKADEIKQKAKADEIARQSSLKDKFAVADYEAGLKSPTLAENALGQKFYVDKDGKQVIVDANKTPPKPVSAAGSALAGAKFEKTVDNAGKELASHSNLFQAIGAVENQLGFKLDDIDDDGKVNGKDIDLPGVSLPLVGRVSAYDGDARTLQSRVAKIFNVELKDRSGAAVTDSELERLRTEFAAGKFNSETEMLQALRDYKNAARVALANAEARFSPEAIAEYRDRGGFTSANIGATAPAAASAPKITAEQAAAELQRRKEATAKK